MKYIKRVTRMAVVQVDEPLFAETTTHVSIEDESGGEFVKVMQCRGSGGQEESVFINKDEWPTLRDVINLMVSECQDEKPEVKP